MFSRRINNQKCVPSVVYKNDKREMTMRGENEHIVHAARFR